MHIVLTRRMMIAGGLSALATQASGSERAYTLVPNASTVTFMFTTSGAQQSGTVPVGTADIRVNTAALARSSAVVTADIRNVRSGLIFVTEAIKSADLLDAARHPIVRFASTRIRLGSQGRISDGAVIEGDLTLRGVTLPIALQAALTRPAGTAPDDLSVLYVRLNGTLSRTAYGATGFPGLADDTVALDIRAEIRARD